MDRFLPRHLHYTSIPVIKNAPLLAPPAGAGKDGRWPTAVFSHGLGGNRNAYSQVAGSAASHGVVVFCPEHRDGSAAVSFVRIPAAQDRYFVRSTRRAVPYRRIPHDATDEVHELRNEQLRVRLWELGLLHEAILALDDDEDDDDDGSGGEKFTNLNRSTPKEALGQFAGRLHVRDPGSIIFMGHSFGAATVTQFLKSVFYADEIGAASSTDTDTEAEGNDPLYVPAPGSAIRRQITPRNVTILLDMWCFPLLAKSTKALFDRPLPAYARPKARDGDDAVDPPPGGRALLAVESQDFYKWTEHLHAKARILSPDPRAAVVEASAFAPSPPPPASSAGDGAPGRLPAKPAFFWVRGAAHLNQSDFGLLFPLLTQRVFGSRAPERALRLNLRAILQVLRANGVPVAPTAATDLVDGGSTLPVPLSAAVRDKLAGASSGDDSGSGSDAEGASVAIDGVFDDAAILEQVEGGKGNIEAWEWIDVVGMGRVADDADGKVKDSDQVAEKQEPDMAGVIEPGVASTDSAGGDGGQEPVAAKVAGATAA